MAVKDEILTLSPLEHVRLRPGVYAGDTSNSNQLVLEVFANALDCYNIGYGDTIKVTIKDGVVTCEDDGQGFIINEKREDGTTTLEAAFSVMNTSGKFTEDGLYEGTSLGLNGMGSKICTFLSHWLKVTTYQNGIAEEIEFKEGIFQKREIIKGTEKIHGTTVSFEPSEEFFDSPTPNLNYLETFFNDICCLCPGLTVVFNDKIIKHDGIDDLLDRKVGSNIEITNSRLVFNETIEKQTLNLGMTFTTTSSSSITPYVNCGSTDTGPHITAIKSAITRVVNSWAKQDGCLKKDDKNLEGSSLQEGLVLVCNITSPTAAYNAQVKTTITKIDTTFLNQVFCKQLEMWLDNNPNDGRAIVEKALVARKAAEAAKRARARVKAEATDNNSKKVLKLPSKLADCYGTDRSKCEIYITEGDSASGNLKNARNRETQAVLPVRGKILNTQKANLEKIMQNAEIVDMINAFGLKISADGKHLTYDKNKIRYGKIIIMSDADVDGAHIKNLFYTFIWNFAPELFVDGFIYAGIPPLYRLKNNKEVLYLKDDNALEQFKKTNDISKYQVSRLKGLGEMDAKETKECLIDPERRNIMQVGIEDFGQAETLFENLMGNSAVPRKQFLQENSEMAGIYV